MSTYTAKDGTILTAESVVFLFKSAEPKKLDIYCDEDILTVVIPYNDNFDIQVEYTTDERHPDKFSVLYLDTKYLKCTLASQQSSELDEDTGLVIEGLYKPLEDFMLSNDYQSGLGIFFDKETFSKSCEADYDYHNPMKAYGLRD